MSKIVVAAALTVIAACAPNAARHDPVRVNNSPVSVDDSQIGQSLQRIAYAGTWDHVVARQDGRFHGTSSRSHNAGDSLIFPFDGSVVRVYGVLGPNGGEADIGIDGRYYGTANFFSTNKRVHTLVFESPPLASGTHMLGLVVKGATDYPHHAYVNIDEVQVLRR